MKRIPFIIIMLTFVFLFSCGGDDSGDKSEKFGITGVALTVGNAPAEKVSLAAAALPEGAYVTWETWIENATWTLPYQPGSYTAWDMQTPADGGDNIAQIVGLAQTCVLHEGVDPITHQRNIYNGYYGDNYFYLTTKGTLHLPDGSTYSSEYRQAIEITPELRSYVETEVYNQCYDTFVDRLTLTLNYVVDPSLL